MFVEQFADGRNTFPGFGRNRPQGPTVWTTTLRYVRASNGETTFKDYGTPWSVVTRNLDITVARTNDQYRGLARFHGGTVKIQDYEPFDLDMNSAFTVNDARLVFSHIDLDTGGTKTRLVGDTNLRYFPEQMYRMESDIDFPWMRKVFFAKNDFELSGKGTFTGTFHLFRETMPDGRIRTGRELKGTFHSRTAWLNTLQFGELGGALKWVPESLAVTDTTSTFYGGDSIWATRWRRWDRRASRRSTPSTPRITASTSRRSPTTSRYRGCASPARRWAAITSSGRAAPSRRKPVTGNCR